MSTSAAVSTYAWRRLDLDGLTFVRVERHEHGGIVRVDVQEICVGVLRTPVGWVLLGVQDPDGHDVRFYTVPLELPADGLGE